MNLTTRQLQAFAALHQQLSFTRAAQQCCLSQPAFSALIQGLEQGLGAQLFERSTRHVVLTRAGQDFLPHAQRLLAGIEQAVQELQGAAQLRASRVTVALLPSLAAHWLPAVLADFAQTHPHIQVQVRDALNTPCLESVQQGQADWALCTALARHPDLHAAAVAEESFYLICPRAHPLAQMQAPIHAQALQSHPFVQMAAHTSVRASVDLWQAQVFGKPVLQTCMEVEQLATVMGMVRAGLGVSLVPALSLAYFQDPGIAIRRLVDTAPSRTIYWVRHRHQGLGPAAQAFYASAQQSLQEWLQGQSGPAMHTA
ncbi:LysR family transcriptional regulator [Comamonas endophytica]|uniref:LysR substrate-binding domain-containing protein n=1 Tax=Comamonas endophytica TaxID=2949090 RepID=A0ABY6G8X6_9BURK|nr:MULTISPECIES: LysR family transcriptional regulator [unclassified Acidovorax]MCD2514068.1 LysR substrate-binding domain-containing protein [Acidovorax sp. D4N7]UYG51210.1 LysR substrate-binding domain-containing protein [Acidovorax sp. 5MLIR]